MSPPPYIADLRVNSNEITTLCIKYRCEKCPSLFTSDNSWGSYGASKRVRNEKHPVDAYFLSIAEESIETQISIMK